MLSGDVCSADGMFYNLEACPYSMCACYFVSNERVCVVLLLFAGVLGIKVKIMLPWDPSGKIGPKKPLPDHVSIVEPKEEILPTTPISEQKGGKPEQPAMPQPVPTA